MTVNKKNLPPRPSVIERPSSDNSDVEMDETASTEIAVAHDLLDILESAKSRPGSNTSGSANSKTSKFQPLLGDGNAPSGVSGKKLAVIGITAVIGIGGISIWLKKNAVSSTAPAETAAMHETAAPAAVVAAQAPQAAKPAVATPAKNNNAAAMAAIVAAHQHELLAQQDAEREREHQKEKELQAQKDREADEERERALREPTSREPASHEGHEGEEADEKSNAPSASSQLAPADGSSTSGSSGSGNSNSSGNANPPPESATQ